MAKKIIVNEEAFKALIKQSVIEESNITDSELNSKVKSAVSDAIKNDRDLEKKIKKIVADSVSLVFKTLWQRDNFWHNEIAK